MHSPHYKLHQQLIPAADGDVQLEEKPRPLQEPRAAHQGQ